MTHEEYKLEEGIKKWNILATLLFLILAFGAFRVLEVFGRLPVSISLFDFSLLTLSVFRLTRLLGYDNITLFLRELFLDVQRVSNAPGAEENIERVSSNDPLKHMFEKLFACPWCLGVWLSLFVVFTYFAFPQMWIFFLMLAVAGLSTLIQLLSNLIGWDAEHRKQMVNKAE